MGKKNLIPIRPEQVKNILKFIDATQDETTKCAIFSQLGQDCFQCSSQAEWLAQFKGNTQAFLDSINVDKESGYWESLIFSEDKTTLTLTGKKVSNCACELANCDDPPLSLCYHCCRVFQETFFKTLFEREVEVEITESYLLGDKRCSTIIHFI